jgi:ATP-dependent DNA helicase DinG
VGERGYELLMPSDSQTPSELGRQMKQRHNCILFGLRSLWTGIDIKGKNLSSVIVTRLPFDPPDSYAEAYGNYLREKGDHPFWEWALPEMINRFRQGIGRLKRDNKDRGLVFILDPRFVTARYKPHLIARLPLMEWKQIRTPADLPGPEIAEWLGVVAPNATGE